MSRKKKIDTKIKLCFLIALVSALTLCVALNALPILEESLRQDLRQSTVGKAEYILSKKEKGLFKTFPSTKNYKVAGALDLGGQIKKGDKKRKIDVTGMHYPEFKTIFGDPYREKGDVNYPDRLESNSVLVSPKLAMFLGVADGDDVELSLYGTTKKFKVKLAPKDNYYVRANENQVIVDKKEIGKWLDIDEGESTQNYIYDVNDREALRRDFKDESAYALEKSINDQYIQTTLKTYFGIDLVVLIFTLAIAYDIMSAAGLIFIKERAKEIGTYLSVGFEKRDVLKKFRRMAVKIGAWGGLSGIIVALIAVQVFAQKSLSTSFLKIDGMPLYFSVSALCSLLLICALMMKSFLSPLRDLLKQSTRSLLLSDHSVSVQTKKAEKKEGLFILLTCVLILIIYSLGNAWGQVKALLILPLSFTTYKSIQLIFNYLIEKISRRTGEGMGLIALKNISTNFYLKKTLLLTTKISIFMVIVGVLIFSILEAMTGFYKDYYADAFIRLDPTESFSLQEKNAIDRIEGVEETLYYSSQTVDLKVDGQTRGVSALGLDDIDAYNKNFVHMKPVWKDGFSAEDFSEGRYVVLSEILMNKYNLGLGDDISIQSGDEQSTFEIVGYARSLQNMGDLIYLNRKEPSFANGMPLNGVYLKGEIPDDLEENIPNFLEEEFSYKNVTHMREDDLTNGMQVIVFFLSFGLLVAVTSLAGIYGNYKLSYFTRRREFAVLSSNGFSRGQIKKVLRLEIILNSGISIVVAVCLFFLFKKPIEETIKLVDLPIQLHLTGAALISLVCMIGLICLINMSLVGKSVKGSLDHIVEHLKER